MEFQASRPHSESFAPHPSVNHEAQLRSCEDLLRRLYVTENKTMKAVMDYMETHFQLQVGVSTYTRVFRELNIRKNAKGNHWAYVDDRIRKRQTQGKLSVVYAQGRLVEHKKVKKEIARHVTTLQQIASATGQGPASPDGWSVKTPGHENDTTVESLENETTMTDDDGTTMMPDARPVEASKGNATVPQDTNQPVYRNEGVSLLKLQLQASRNFYHSLLAPTHNATLNAEAGYLATRLLACKAFITFSSPLSASWDWPEAHYNNIAWDIISVMHGFSLASCYPSIPAYDEAIQIMACAMDNHTDLLQSALANGFKNIGREQLNDVLKTALFLTAEYGLVGAARTLVGLGADQRATDMYGDTCRRVAEKQGHLEIVALLRSRDEASVLGEVAGRAARMGVVVKEAVVSDPELESRANVEQSIRPTDEGKNVLGKVTSRVTPIDVAVKEATDQDCKMKQRTDTEEDGCAANDAQKGSRESGPFGFNKWFDSVVMPWAQRNWDSFGSSVSMGSFRVKLHSRPTSK